MTTAKTPFQDRLESELAAHHRRLYGDRTPTASARSRRVRVVWAVAALLVATVAVGAVPVRVSTGLGTIITIELPSSPSIPGEGDLFAHVMSRRFGADQVSVSAGVSGDRARILLLLFGEHVDAAALRRDLVQAWPAFSTGAWKMQAIETTLETSLARMLGHRVFALDVNPGQRAQLRSRIVQGLAAQGWTGDVSIREVEGVRIIRLESKETTEHPDMR